MDDTRCRFPTQELLDPKGRESFSVAVAGRTPKHQDACMGNDKTGHPSAGLYLQLNTFVKNVPSFHPNVLQALECVPCIMAKATQSSVRLAATKVDLPIEEINIDTSGPFIPATINGESMRHIFWTQELRSSTFRFSRERWILEMSSSDTLPRHTTILRRKDSRSRPYDGTTQVRTSQTFSCNTVQQMA